MKTRLLQIVMALLCSYLGFKRNELIGILVVSVIAITVVRKKGKDFLRTNQIVTFAVLIACFSFVLAVKYLDQMTLLLSVLDIYRIRVYRFIREIYSVSPFYIGKGYSYVNYILGNQNKLLGTSHSDLVRVYTEMGFWGFVAWIWYYFTYIPRYIYLAKEVQRLLDNPDLCVKMGEANRKNALQYGTEGYFSRFCKIVNSIIGENR